MDPSTSTLPIRAASAVLKTKFHHGAGPESMDQLGRLQLRGFLVDKYFRMLSKKLHHDVRGPFSWQFAREPAPEARARARAGSWAACGPSGPGQRSPGPPHPPPGWNAGTSK